MEVLIPILYLKGISTSDFEEALAALLDRVCAEVGYPKSIRVDQGPEFVSKDLDLWAYRSRRGA